MCSYYLSNLYWEIATMNLNVESSREQQAVAYKSALSLSHVCPLNLESYIHLK